MGRFQAAGWLAALVGLCCGAGTGVALEAPAKAEPKAEAVARYEVETHVNLAYRTDKEADAEKHRLDVYVPKGAKDFPVVFFVHGGTWRSGNKGMYAPVGLALAKCGIGAVVINYRLSPKVQHPAHVEDVARAFAWAVANVATYGGRADRLFLCGHSAGGHLVSLLALDEQYLKAVGRSVKDVTGVVSVSGVYSILPEFALFHPIFGKDAEVCRLASPLTHAAGKHPPFLLVYADKELPGLDKMAKEMDAALTKAKCEVALKEIKDRNHISIIVGAAGPSDPLSAAVREFVTRHTK